MYTHFNTYLGIDDNDLPQENIVISDTDIDGNFILHHFISHYIKNKGKICLLGFAQTKTHYTNACHKLGLNLQKAIENNQLVFIDTLKLLFDGLIFESGVGDDMPNMFASATHPEFSLQSLLNLIVVNITADVPTIVIIDDVCSLVNIGVPVQVIADFLHYCETLKSQKRLSFVFLTHGDVEDPDYSILLSWLKHYATLEIHVRALKTGYSKELSGEMSILRRSSQNPSTISKRIHFKLLDKDVKFFAPGTSPAVL